MAIIGFSGQALNGIQRGMEDLQRSAAEVGRVERSNVAPSTGELAQPLVAQMEAARQVEASAMVLQADDGVLGSLLDVRA